MNSIRSRLLGTALTVALAAPVWAQVAPAPATPAAPAAGEPAPATPPLVNPAPAVELGTPPPAAPPADGAAAPTTAETPAAPGAAPAPGDPAAPEVYEIVKATHGDWQVRCSPDGNDCFMYQLALDEQKNPVAEVSLLKLPAGGEAAAGATIVTPLGTLLTSGVVLQTDAGERRQYPFSWCSQVGCFARFGLAGSSVDAMKRGSTSKVTLTSVAAPDRPLVLNLSLTGFTAAYDSLQVPTPNAAGAAGQ